MVKPSIGNATLGAAEEAEARGDLLEAARAYEAALIDADPLIIATAHNALGRIAWQQGNFDASLSAFEKALAIAVRHDAAEARARAEIGIGNVCYARGNYARARELYDRVRVNATSRLMRGRVLLNLGTLANIEGDMAEAERQYRAAYDDFVHSGDAGYQAQALHNLGMLYADRLWWDDADRAYAQALDLANDVGNRELVGLIVMNRSELSCAMGRYVEAVERCDEALAIFAELGAEVSRGTTLRWKGRALRELGQYAQSERALTEAMRIGLRAQARLLAAEAMQELGSTLSLSGDLVAARKWLQRALELFESLGASREVTEVRADIRALDGKT